MSRRPDGSLSFDIDGRDWPNREASRFRAGRRAALACANHGQGPVLLLLHGTGASSHTWRDIAPIIARDFTLMMPDLPGHRIFRPG